jgi:predicted GNAT superfamily acetyltransferase
MSRETQQQINHELQVAQEIFKPEKFGFEKYGQGWTKNIPGAGLVAFSPISWEHNQVIDKSGANPLNHVANMQEKVWGMDSSDVVPGNVLSIVKDAGGALIVAYDRDLGLSEEGWRGFVLGFGSRSGDMVSHMAAVRENVRGGSGLGTNLKLIQAHQAIASGHTKMHWTYDPMRGLNASVNFALGGQVNELTINKYGKLKTELYGDVPTDRFTVEWELSSDLTKEKLKAIERGEKLKLKLSDIENVPQVNEENLGEIVTKKPDQVKYEIPGNIDKLTKIDEEKAANWRRDMQVVMSGLLNTKEAVVDQNKPNDPAFVETQKTRGSYFISDFVTSKDGNERKSFYILTRKKHA